MTNKPPTNLEEVMAMVENDQEEINDEVVTTSDEKAIEKIEKEMTLPALIRESKIAEQETQDAIQAVVEDSIRVVTNRNMPHKAERISEEIIARLNDNNNQIGQLFMQKKVLNHQGRLFKRLMELAMGIRQVKIVKGQPVVYEVPPDANVIWKLLAYIDGSKSNAIVKTTKTQKASSIDEFLGGKE